MRRTLAEAFAPSPLRGEGWGEEPLWRFSCYEAHAASPSTPPMNFPASPGPSPQSSSPCLIKDGGEEANVALRAAFIV